MPSDSDSKNPIPGMWRATLDFIKDFLAADIDQTTFCIRLLIVFIVLLIFMFLAVLMGAVQKELNTMLWAIFILICLMILGAIVLSMWHPQPDRHLAEAHASRVARIAPETII